MQVRSILHNKGSLVATIRPDATIEEAAQVLDQFGIGALVVSSDTARIEGVFSERDLTRAVAEAGTAALHQTVTSAMTHDVLTCGPDDTADEVMAVMTPRRIRHLPVVDGAEMIGIVSIGDVVKRRVDELERENGALTEYLYSGR